MEGRKAWDQPYYGTGASSQHCVLFLSAMSGVCYAAAKMEAAHS